MCLNVRPITRACLEKRSRIADRFADQFHALPGLVQKYFTRTSEPGQVAGVFLWDSKEAMEAFPGTDLAREIEAAYHLLEPPEIEVYEVLA